MVGKAVGVMVGVADGLLDGGDVVGLAVGVQVSPSWDGVGVEGCTVGATDGCDVVSSVGAAVGGNVGAEVLSSRPCSRRAVPASSLPACSSSASLTAAGWFGAGSDLETDREEDGRCSHEHEG